MALSFIDYDYDTIDVLLFMVCKSSFVRDRKLSNADFLKKRRNQEMFVSSGIHFVVVRRIISKKIYHQRRC